MLNRIGTGIVVGLLILGPIGFWVWGATIGGILGYAYHANVTKTERKNVA
jgi:hypothetical protein